MNTACSCIKMSKHREYLLHALDPPRLHIITVIITPCSVVFEVVLLVIGRSVSVPVRAVTVFVLKANLVLRIVIPGIVLR